jgi:hypothetical protein
MQHHRPGEPLSQPCRLRLLSNARRSPRELCRCSRSGSSRTLYPSRSWQQRLHNVRYALRNMAALGGGDAKRMRDVLFQVCLRQGAACCTMSSLTAQLAQALVRTDAALRMGLLGRRCVVQLNRHVSGACMA